MIPLPCFPHEKTPAGFIPRGSIHIVRQAYTNTPAHIENTVFYCILSRTSPTSRSAFLWTRNTLSML